MILDMCIVVQRFGLDHSSKSRIESIFKSAKKKDKTNLTLNLIKYFCPLKNIGLETHFTQLYKHKLRLNGFKCSLRHHCFIL